MSSEKSFPERFKKFLKSDKKNLKALPEIKLNQELLSNLSKNSLLSTRLETIKELEESYETLWLEEGGIEKIWDCIKDLLKFNIPSEHRHIALNLMGATITNSGMNRLGVNRVIFITYIVEAYEHEDMYILFDFFCCVVENGRHIDHVEEFMGTLISEWFIKRLLRDFSNKEIVINFITVLLKFNAAHIEDYVIRDLVRAISDYVLKVKNREELLACNAFLDTIICYVYIPAGTLYGFMYSLTLQASIPNMVDQVWKIVQNLLRTEVGVTGIHYLCSIIETANYRVEQFHFIRGAIFFLAKALWSEHRIRSLTYTPMPILRTLHHACSHSHPLVIYEIGISLSFLVRNCSSDLHLSSWDLLIDILGQLLRFTANHNVKEHSKMMFNVMNTIMDQIEDKISHENFTGTMSLYYDLFDQFSEIRQESSVLLMLDYKIRNLRSFNSQWLTDLLALSNRHFRIETRQAIRLKMLSLIKYLFDKFTRKDSFDICHIVVLNIFEDIDKDDDIMVRKAASILLVHMILNVRSNIITKLLQFLEKIVFRPYANKIGSQYTKEEDLEDVLEGIKGLILIFKKKIWCLPSCHAIQAYQILMLSLELHYRDPPVLQHMSHIRKLVFDMIFEMRADARYHLGLPNCPEALLPVREDDDETMDKLLPKYTSYIIVDHKHGQKPKSDFFIFPDDDTSSTSSMDNSSDDLEDDDLRISKDFGSEKAAIKDYMNCVYKRPLSNQDTVTLLLGEPVDSLIPCVGDRFNTLNSKRDENHGSSSPSSEEKAKGDPPIVVNYKYEEDKVYSSDFDVDNLEPAIEVTHLSLTQAARLVIVAMKTEKDWSLLKTILEKTPQVLQNKALILSKDGNDIDYLATTLCYLIREKDIRLFYNTPAKFSKSDFICYVFPVIATLASYHQHLKIVYQTNVIRCLHNLGMFTKSGPLCVSALTTCVLEMQAAMIKELKDVMLSLSKTSATVQNAQPTLEFLSTVLHLPRIYADFSRVQTFTVIAICTPYTNPFKFNPYIVSLAYHVICIWFLKCRKNYRQHFVRYISKNLYMILLNEGSAKKNRNVAVQEQANASARPRSQSLFEASKLVPSFLLLSPTKIKKSVNEEALEEARARTTRTRSFSTHSSTEMGDFKMEMKKTLGLQKKEDKEMIQFHRDLHEICVDFMARNCFEINSPLVQRTETCEMLLKNGISKTWLLGTRIITITTSGCYDRPFKRGICEQCCYRCHMDDDSINERKTSQERPDRRRRHKSDFQSPVSHEAKMKPQSKDDIHMRPLSKDSSQSTVTDPDEDDEDYVCACWCRGWAEVFIRQPTGNDCFMYRSQNLINHISREDTIPVNHLSTFYAASVSQAQQAETPSSFSDKDLYNYSQLPEEIRPRANTGTSEKTQASVDWSNSASGPSSGAASLASSDMKLDAKIDSENQESPHVPVHHCYSNPEVNKGLETNLVCGAADVTKPSNLAHSKSLVETASPTGPGEKNKNKLVTQSPSGVNSPSPPPNTEETHRIRHYSAMQMKSSASSVTVNEKENDDLQPIKRGRGHTISVMNPASSMKSYRNIQSKRPTLAETSGATAASTSSLPGDSFAGAKEKEKPDRPPGLTPNSVFLHLYYQPILRSGCFKPIWVPPEFASSLRVLDTISPLEHHKIGVLYVGPGQKTETQILKNTSGTQRYYNFLDGLGAVYEIDELPPKTNLGGLDKRGVDGDLVYMWKDDLMQVVFHVATKMPNKSSDPNCNNKKRHIGNDFVNIVYNNSGMPYARDTIMSQFNHAVVEIVPGDHNTNIVRLLVKPELSSFVSWDRADTVRLVSDVSLPILGRQMALHANLASTVWESLKKSTQLPYATNWMERLRKIRAIREKILGKEKSDRHLTEMQEHQYPSDDNVNNLNDDLYYSNLDFADWIDIEKQENVGGKDRSSTGSFFQKNRHYLD